MDRRPRSSGMMALCTPALAQTGAAGAGSSTYGSQRRVCDIFSKGKYIFARLCSSAILVLQEGFGAVLNVRISLPRLKVHRGFKRDPLRLPVHPDRQLPAGCCRRHALLTVVPVAALQGNASLKLLVFAPSSHSSASGTLVARLPKSIGVMPRCILGHAPTFGRLVLVDRAQTCILSSMPSA